MRLAIFGLTVSSSWGNGHATIWRGLLNALVRRGHSVTFFERDVPYYAHHRDLRSGAGYDLVLYKSWAEVEPRAHEAVSAADSAIITSYYPDALPACDLVLDSSVPVRVFYDLDSPVTLERLSRGERVEYIPPYGLSPFDLVLSYAGGKALEGLRERLGARHVAPLYGGADPEMHQPVTPDDRFTSDLSYLGTYAADRQASLEQLFIEPARHCPKKKFMIGGSMYPTDFPWSENIWFVDHVAPPQHPAFYSSSRLTLSVTRAAMVDMGYCPSGRLFEAAACNTPVVTDEWEGLNQFFEPGREILVANSAADVVAGLALDADELRRIGEAARARVMSEHTAQHRGDQLLRLLGVPA
jgi:spore maturation protein CgeB